MALYDTLILVVSLTMILISLQSFLDKTKRQVASEVIKATFLMVTGIYFFSFWYTQVTLVPNSTMGSSYS